MDKYQDYKKEEETEINGKTTIYKDINQYVIMQGIIIEVYYTI